MYAAIVGWGKCLPAKVVTNDDLAQIVETSDEWISKHTGIRERRVVGPGETAVSMAAAAARDALAVAKLQSSDLDLIIVSTYSPDYHLPGAAPILQAELGATHAAAFDLRAGCPGFLYALSVANQFIASGVYQRVLVVGTEVISQFLNWADRRTCVLFGDGAGAVILEASEQPTGFLSFSLGTKGRDYDALIYRAAGSRHPINAEPFAEDLRSLQMDGQRLLSFAVRSIGPAIREQLRANGLSVEDIALVIPQQSNLRFMEWIAEQFGFPMEKIVVNVDKYANTSSASVAIALCEALEQKRIHQGDHVLLLSFGAGLNWAASVLRYGCVERVPVSRVETVIPTWFSLHDLRQKLSLVRSVGISTLNSARNLAMLPFLTRSKRR